MISRILSIDGGGIRGVIPAIWLAELQQRLGRSLSDVFDFIAGTSTGAIIACGIANGVDIEEIVKLYTERGKEVFPPPSTRFWSRILRIFSTGLAAPKYDGEGLNAVLKNVFGNACFGSMKKSHVLVTSYDVRARRSIVFKSNKPEHQALPIWEICRASASAPAYFPAHVMEINGIKRPLVDGGIVANNPTACAIAEAARQCGPEISGFIAASFGTGDTTRPITIAESQEWGALEWALPIIDVLFDGSSDAVDYIARHILAKENYFRFQTSVFCDKMDDASESNVKLLTELAKKYLQKPSVITRLDLLANKLLA